MKVIKLDDTGSVLIDTLKGFNVWVDVWESGNEIFADWNKYIFFHNCAIDMGIKAFQENTENYEICSELAIDYYIKHKK